MEITYLQKVTKKVAFVELHVAVNYGDEDMPYDAPMRKGDMFNVLIDVDEKKVIDWPVGKTLDIYMKVCDQGTYILLDADKEEILSKQDGYCPNNLLPGAYGDYLELKIDENGIVTNWLDSPDFSDFAYEDY